jgi:solute carrier family 35 protein
MLLLTRPFVRAQGILQLWPYSNTLLTLQMVASIAIIYSGKFMGLLTVQPINLKSARNLLPVVFFYNANVGFALAGLQALNIPVFNALKRLTPVLVVGAKYVIGDAIPSRHVLFSVLLIVIGCIVASFGDLSFDLVGYALALTSCVLQTTYLLLVEKSGSEKGYNSHELLLYNATLSLPVLSTLIFGTGEAAAALSSFNTNMASSTTFLPLLVFSLFMGSLLNYTLFLCTLMNSALTTTVVGAMKALLSSVRSRTIHNFHC